MSDFFRRASDAFHNRQRQDSTGSTGAPTSPDAAKSPEEPLNERSGSVQSESHVNEAFAGTATTDTAQPTTKKHYPWGWKRHQENAPEKRKPSVSDEVKKDDVDWVIGT
ncbi:hypothetical protein N7509_001377 [Penicillium cosmopolitanum]|uniref:Uncharacterized protein n=1 Tax=Penicillium cosmopolitanum TaxID=1131564 RepID=A0A9W9WC51_9EURO|nr:uncharacterized protein N7509_001377 [Penicillium cosmopolitanum]KAJ5414750.1 hypothetical protein N7509_001377 [Penicillium cosmopolitanum]